MVDPGLRSIDEDTEVKPYIVELSEQLIDCFDGLELVDKYDVYEVLLSYWHEVMGDDVYLVSVDGYGAARTWETSWGNTPPARKRVRKGSLAGRVFCCPGHCLSPYSLPPNARKSMRRRPLPEETQSRLDEFVEEQTGDDGYLKDHLNDKG